MKISLITATWNSEATISDTMSSVLCQDYQDVEYIVVDGASTDSTVDLIKAQGSLVDCFVSEKDQGIYDALNKGIGLATGDVIGFMHSDDVFAHKHVLSRVALAFQDEAVDSVYGDLEYVSKNNLDSVVRLWKSGEYFKTKLKHGWMPPHPTFYMKRSCYESFGRFNLNYRIAADYDSMLRYLWKNNVSTKYIPEVMVKMRVGGESNRSLSNIINKTKEDAQVMMVNGIPVIRALVGKNISKIPQFIFK